MMRVHTTVCFVFKIHVLPCFFLRQQKLCFLASFAALEKSISSDGCSAASLRSCLTGSHLEALNIFHHNKQLWQKYIY